MATYSAPGKVILFGEHFVVHGSQAILCAIELRVTVKATPNTTGGVSIHSILGSANVCIDVDHTLIAPILRPFYHVAAYQGCGIHMEICSDIPIGAGLGSSSACCVAAAGALLYDGPRCMPEDIMSLSLAAERSVYPESSGADCAASVFGGVIKYAKDTGPVQQGIQSGIRLVVADSGKPHSTAQMVMSVHNLASRRPEHFKSMTHEAAEISGRALDAMRCGNTKKVGELASQNQQLLKQIGVSNSRLDYMIRLADTYSYGSKITGAGGGGCIVAITDDTNYDDTMTALTEQGYQTYGVRIDRDGATPVNVA